MLLQGSASIMHQLAGFAKQAWVHLGHSLSQADGVSEATSVPERTTSNTQQYADACRQAAKSAGVPVLDMFSELPNGAPPDWAQSWLNDGLHFSSAGQHRVFELILRSIEAHFADLR